MKFGLGSASGMAGAMQGFAGVENQKMQYQQEMNKQNLQNQQDLNKQIADMMADKGIPYDQAQAIVTGDVPAMKKFGLYSAPANTGGAADSPVPVQPGPTVRLIGQPNRAYIPRLNTVNQQLGTNLAYAQTASNANGGIPPGHQDLGNGVTFHPPSNMYFQYGQPVMALLS